MGIDQFLELLKPYGLKFDAKQPIKISDLLAGKIGEILNEILALSEVASAA